MSAKQITPISFLSLIKSYLLALRPRQWTKNLIVFAAPIFAFRLDSLTLASCSLAFVLFCSISSSFYLINDILDVESDRRHPVKCKRPIAAGLINLPTATTLALVLLIGAIGCAWVFDRGLGAAITSYGLLQIAYNLKLKRKVILDILAIAIGFVLRAYAGAAAANILLSSWFLICTAMLALFLAIEKRKAELRLLEYKDTGHTRVVLYRYSLSMLSRMENTVTTGAIMSYALWSSGPQVNGASTPWMLLTLPFVLYGIFRYQLLSDPKEIERRSYGNQDLGGRTERPEEILLTDRPILYTVIAWIMTVLMVMTLKHYYLIA
ncbi:MAG: decaprenyl-phosphate phosphoribosyltransferase [Alkalinema sp. CACIAM 70d]|nr:MAG: decaprenyl-phosphate phosphoribosyltransferase [Alkalinema sp. CACIAM 70d]